MEFFKKLIVHDKVKKLKVRLIARRFKQKDRVDYINSFTPIIKWPNIQIIITIAFEKNEILSILILRLLF